MMRTPLVALAVLATSLPATAQRKKDAPKLYPPDAATLKQIEVKTTALHRAVADLRDGTPGDVKADVAVFAKAAEWIVRHGEWFHKDSAKQTLTVLDEGLERARAAARGQTPWREVRGRPIARGYYSSVDGSVQPFRVTLPEGYDKSKKWRLDIVLHGRNNTLTEVNFLHSRPGTKSAPQPADTVLLEPYGRGNNAYRWAGETDVRDSVRAFLLSESADPTHVVLRGFSMGGAGVWHIGLHHPFSIDVLGPGAGFTTTHGYISNLPARLPDHQEKCLRIYDAVNYAENVFNVPVVAYSGEKDAQKQAADNIEQALKSFKEPVTFTHIIAPGLEHRQPPEWQAKLDAEYRKHLTTDRKRPDRVRFVTYTTRYGDFAHGTIKALDRHYEKAVVDSRWTKDRLTVATSNITALVLKRAGWPVPAEIAIDGQTVPVPQSGQNAPVVFLVKTKGKWALADTNGWPRKATKAAYQTRSLQGPIDDAFMDSFHVIGPTGKGWHPTVTRHAAASLSRFEHEWDRYLRGGLPKTSFENERDGPSHETSLVLFGDPGSNPMIAKVVEKLPIVWTKDRLAVNGVEYDPKTHVPVLIYPLDHSRYVVINSGHTFHEADFKGTNALLYPRLGDWAVLRPVPTGADPAAAEVVAAGLFDENWTFPVNDGQKSEKSPKPGR